MGRRTYRNFTYYKNHFEDFYSELDSRSRDKINQVLYLVKYLEIIPKQHLKLLKGSKGIYEIRINIINGSARIMCFFDTNDRIVLLNCFKKTSQKTPLRDIRLAKKLKYQYYEEQRSKR